MNGIAGLLITFFRIGCFTFGGAYAAIPLIREEVLARGWLTEEMLTDMIAVSESTPGSLMVNLATYIGSVRGGVAGAAAATLAVILPAFLVILIVMAALRAVISRPPVQAAIDGMKASVLGVIFSAGVILSAAACFPVTAGGRAADPAAIAVTALLFAVSWIPWRWGNKRRKPTPILLILIGALFGIVLYGL